jgi:hypothetical protein
MARAVTDFFLRLRDAKTISLQQNKVFRLIPFLEKLNPVLFLSAA